jgi:protein archease
MKNFELLPHTADIRLKVSGSGYEELFAAALEGMNYIIKNDFDKTSTLMNFRDVINVESVDRSTLLIDFLSEVLTLSHQYKAIYRTLKFRILEEKLLLADIEGKQVEGFDEDIKAVTYTEANIKKNENGLYETVIVFDI